jgi:hypothetical protein
MNRSSTRNCGGEEAHRRKQFCRHDLFAFIGVYSRFLQWAFPDLEEAVSNPLQTAVH